MKCRDHCRSLRILAFAVVFAVLVAMSAAAHADSTSIGRLYVTTDWRGEVRFGDVQHYAISIRPEHATNDVYMLLLTQHLRSISVESTMPCFTAESFVLCQQAQMTTTHTITVVGTVAGPVDATIIVGDATWEQWRMPLPTQYLGCACGTIPMPQDWLLERLYVPLVRNHG